MRSFASLPSAAKAPATSVRSAIRIGPVHSGAEREAERTASRVKDSRPHAAAASEFTLHPAPVRIAKAADSATHRELLPHSGHPLDPNARARMESRFHFDFSRVRIHRDEAAQETASALSARAFTLGSNVAFGKGQYALETPAGERLLAHELTHVVQQTQSATPLIQRDPLDPLDPQELFGDRDASVVDQAVAASPVAQYIPKKALKTIAGNYEYSSPAQFAKHFEDYGKSQELSSAEVGGFVDRRREKPIQLRSTGKLDRNLVRGSTLEAAVHETIHLNSKQTFAGSFGTYANEGVTEYFAERVLKAAGTAYRKELALASGMMAAIGPDGERQIAESFFEGKTDLYSRVVKALDNNRTTAEWREKMGTADEKGWERANVLLADALKHPAGSVAPTAPAPAAPAAPAAKIAPPAKVDPPQVSAPAQKPAIGK